MKEEKKEPEPEQRPGARGEAPEPDKSSDVEVSGGSSDVDVPDTSALEEARRSFDQLLRLKAEFENYRKRVDREKPELVRWGKFEVLLKLLPLYDCLLQASGQLQQSTCPGGAGPGGAGSAAGRGNPGLEAVRGGMELIFKEFRALFESEGVQPIECVGKPYDHAQHDVLGMVETADVGEGMVVEEVQKGYLMNGKVLRPAKVRISKKPKGVEHDEDNRN